MVRLSSKKSLLSSPFAWRSPWQTSSLTTESHQDSRLTWKELKTDPQGCLHLRLLPARSLSHQHLTKFHPQEAIKLSTKPTSSPFSAMSPSISPFLPSFSYGSIDLGTPSIPLSPFSAMSLSFLFISSFKIYLVPLDFFRGKNSKSPQSSNSSIFPFRDYCCKLEIQFL